MNMHQSKHASIRNTPGLSLLLFILILITTPVISADQIHKAAAKGNLEEVERLISDTPDLLNARDNEGRTPLHLACRGVHLNIVKFLIEKGAGIDVPDANEVVPLHSLAARNNPEAIKLLLSRKASVDVQDHGGHSALHHAAMNNADAAAEALLQGGADVELRDDYKRTPLLLCARERGGPATTRILLKGGADVDARDKFGSTSLELAAWRGKKEVVDLLLDAGARIDADKPSARGLFSQAASKGLIRLFNELIKAGADPTFKMADRGTLLHAAAAGGSVNIMEVLLSKGMDISGQDIYGWTPLHYAARDGRTEAVEWLMSKGADINKRTVMGQSPFNVAEERGFDSVRTLLADKGADTGPIRFPKLKGDYLGQTPPGERPELFAPGIVSSIWGLHSTAVFSPDGDTVLWAPMVEVPGKIYSEGGIMMSERINGIWTAPKWAPFSNGIDGDVPFFSPDGKRIYFISTQELPDGSGSGTERIWYTEKTEEGWGQPLPVNAAVNSYPHHWQFSVDAGHTLYFSSNIPQGRGGGDIYSAEYNEGIWQEPKNLGPVINTEKGEMMPFISPDGSTLLFSREYDLYISFRDKDGNWREARDLGRPINSSSIDLCPVITPDGKYLFFISQRGSESHAWWVDADFLQKMKNEIKMGKKESCVAFSIGKLLLPGFL